MSPLGVCSVSGLQSRLTDGAGLMLPCRQHGDLSVRLRSLPDSSRQRRQHGGRVQRHGHSLPAGGRGAVAHQPDVGNCAIGLYYGAGVSGGRGLGCGWLAEPHGKTLQSYTALRIALSGLCFLRPKTWTCMTGEPRMARHVNCNPKSTVFMCNLPEQG